MKSGQESGGILVILSPVNILQHKLERAVKCPIHQPFQPRCLYMSPIIQIKTDAIFYIFNSLFIVLLFASLVKQSREGDERERKGVDIVTASRT